MQIFTSPQAMPQAMPQAEYQKFRIFQNIAPGFALRHCPRANKNLHMASGHASALPQGKYANLFDLRHSLRGYANFYFPLGYAPGYASGRISKFSEFSEFFRNLAPGVAPGYAPGQTKICICHRAMPRAIKYANFICPQGSPQATPQAKFQKISEISNFSEILPPGVAPRLRRRASKNLHIPSGCTRGHKKFAYSSLWLCVI
ncbi:hypothetical protein T4A_1838 [Trichinella pseudospiralis]|uniref:Uncharacterized protein n=1 Tax=Trichinella pseudospiralis TaxID=6337 RepID=A0A0V1E794_TRIPS|nr:hypothetical protein T4A_1838 [Trichinella pseudospiralis]